MQGVWQNKHITKHKMLKNCANKKKSVKQNGNRKKLRKENSYTKKKNTKKYALFSIKNTKLSKQFSKMDWDGIKKMETDLRNSLMLVMDSTKRTQNMLKNENITLTTQIQSHKEFGAVFLLDFFGFCFTDCVFLSFYFFLVSHEKKIRMKKKHKILNNNHTHKKKNKHTQMTEKR